MTYNKNTIASHQSLIFGLLIFGLLFFPTFASAQVLPPCTSTGNCGLCDFIQTFINIIRWVLGILGGTALLLMVWHGFSWLIAAGNKEKIDAGRKGLMHTVIGVLIIVGSWMIINMAMIFLLAEPGAPVAPTQLLFKTAAGGKAWYTFCGGGSSGVLLCKEGYSNGTPCGGGNFCCTNQCAKTCDNKNYNDPCHYLACTNKYYDNYRCTLPANCLPNTALSGYCTGGANNVCCAAVTPGAQNCP